MKNGCFNKHPSIKKYVFRVSGIQHSTTKRTPTISVKRQTLSWPCFCHHPPVALKGATGATATNSLQTHVCVRPLCKKKWQTRKAISKMPSGNLFNRRSLYCQYIGKKKSTYLPEVIRSISCLQPKILPMYPVRRVSSMLSLNWPPRMSIGELTCWYIVFKVCEIC